MTEDVSPLTDRRRFTFWCEERARYGDTDRQGHVNNAVFATFCESGRVGLFHSQETPFAPPGTEFVIARLTLDFRAEILWRERIEIGTVVLGLGRSSFTLGQGLFRGDVCVATAESILVLMDLETRRATPLPPRLRARLAALAYPPLAEAAAVGGAEKIQ